MKQAIAIAVIISASLILTASAPQPVNSIEEVEAVMWDCLAAWNARDVDALAGYHDPNITVFGRSGRLLRRGWDRNAVQERFDRLVTYRCDMQHLEVQRYGDIGIATGYIIVSETRTDGSNFAWTTRFTDIWRKQNGQWQIIHNHNSPLDVPLPDSTN